MKTYYLIKLLSDLSLNPTSSTMIRVNNLQEISAYSLARLWFECFEEGSPMRTLILTGEVQISDGHPACHYPDKGYQRSLMRPSHWYNIVNGHALQTTEFKRMDTTSGCKSKQMAREYIWRVNEQQVNRMQVGNQTSHGHSRKYLNRAVEEEKFFLRNKIEAQHQFIFTVEDGDKHQKALEEFHKYLHVGYFFMGTDRKSYGHVAISDVSEDYPEKWVDDDKFKKEEKDGFYVYAKSDLQGCGIATNPVHWLHQAGITKEKSSFRLINRHRYNTKRKTQYASELVIEKGSVFHFKNEEHKEAFITKFCRVKVFGKGEILENEAFLLKETGDLEYTKSDHLLHSDDKHQSSSSSRTEILLDARYEKSKQWEHQLWIAKKKLHETVLPSNSQLGAAAKYVKYLEDNVVWGKFKEFIDKPTRAKEWENINKLINEMNKMMTSQKSDPEYIEDKSLFMYVLLRQIAKERP